LLFSPLATLFSLLSFSFFYYILLPKNAYMKKALKKSQVLTNEQLEKQLLGNNCCGKKMTLTEVHEEKDNKICSKYVCSRCHSSIFDYGDKPKKSIVLTTKEYEDLLAEVRNIHQRLYEAKGKY
jgi:superfamily II helicase